MYNRNVSIFAGHSDELLVETMIEKNQKLNA